jgi:hypothetical protein
MSDSVQSTEQKESGRGRRPLDYIIILLLLAGAAFCFNQFRLDILGNEKPVGTIIIGNNVVQQRMANRALWDRLDADSPIYSGDQIRTADLSNATLLIGPNSIDLNEKTVIRIQRSPDDKDSILISLDEGNLVITTVAGGGNISLNLMGRQVDTAPGTILSASVGKDGAIMQVSEGIATLIEGRQKREISSGRMIALDSGGATVQELPIQAHRSDTPAEPVIEEEEQVPLESVSLLPAPLNRLPLTGHRIGIEQLKESDSIVFTWSATQGANAYIFALFQETGNGRRQIIRVPPANRRSWTLENVAALDRGTFIWQVEAVGMNSAGTIERRGSIGENYFIIDIPRSGDVQMENPGTLYGE